jgi:hypothetical protein
LGGINTGTLKGDFASWWARVTGNPDPYQVIGEDNIPEGMTLRALRDASF